MAGFSTVVYPQVGRWWRVNRYEISNGVIQPSPGASVEEYDPWGQYQASRAWGNKKNAPAPPYQSLVNLMFKLRFDARHELTVDSEAELLSWCAQHGLLGLIPHYFDRSPPQTVQLVSIDDGPFWEKEGFVYTGGEWLEYELDNPYEPFTQDELRSFFPHVSSPDGDTVPKPLTAEFWAVYGEPVRHFISAAVELAESIKALRTTSRRAPTGSEVAESLDTLSQLTAKLAPVARFNPSSKEISLEWRSRSLMASYAMMVLQDLAHKRRAFVCAVCEDLFVSHSPQALYCSERCRNTAEKRRRRKRDREG